MQLYLHTIGGLALVDIDNKITAGDFAEQHAGAKADTWLQDTDKTLKQNKPLADQVTEKAHVFAGTCMKVDVTIRYGGETKRDKFAPAMRIQTVFDWATGNRGFDLTDAERAKHTLGSIDKQTILERSDHVGQFADTCEITLDLAPKDRFQG